MSVRLGRSVGPIERSSKRMVQSSCMRQQNDDLHTFLARHQAAKAWITNIVFAGHNAGLNVFRWECANHAKVRFVLRTNNVLIRLIRVGSRFWGLCWIRARVVIFGLCVSISSASATASFVLRPCCCQLSSSSPRRTPVPILCRS